MSQEQIIENNKLIAEFMGLKIITADDFNKLGEASYTGENSKVKWGIVEYLAYHTDWRWTMEVIDKIENIDKTIVEMGRSFCKITPILYDSKKDVLSRYEEIYVHPYKSTRLNSTYQAIVKFIQFYTHLKSQLTTTP